MKLDNRYIIAANIVSASLYCLTARKYLPKGKFLNISLGKSQPLGRVAVAGIAAATVTQYFNPHKERKEDLLYSSASLVLILAGQVLSQTGIRVGAITTIYFGVIYSAIAQNTPTALPKRTNFEIYDPFSSVSLKDIQDDPFMLALDDYIIGKGSVEEIFYLVCRQKKSYYDVECDYLKLRTDLTPIENERMGSLKQKLDQVELGKNALTQAPSQSHPLAMIPFFSKPVTQYFYDHMEEITTYLDSVYIASIEKQNEIQVVVKQLEVVFEKIFNEQGNLNELRKKFQQKLEEPDCDLDLLTMYILKSFPIFSPKDEVLIQFFYRWYELRSLTMQQGNDRLKLNFFHGTNFGALVNLSQADFKLKHYGRLKRLGVVPFAGELYRGATVIGVNQKALSGCSMHSIQTAKNYAQAGRVSLEESKKRIEEFQNTQSNWIKEHSKNRRFERTADVTQFCDDIPQLILDIRRLKVAGSEWIAGRQEDLVEIFKKFHADYKEYQKTSDYREHMPKPLDPEGVYGHGWHDNCYYQDFVALQVGLEEALEVFEAPLQSPSTIPKEGDEYFRILIGAQNVMARYSTPHEILAHQSLTFGEEIKVAFTDKEHVNALAEWFNSKGLDVQVHPMEKVDEIEQEIRLQDKKRMNFFPFLLDSSK